MHRRVPFSPPRRRARLRSSLPPRQEGADSQSPKPAAGSGHGLITWDGLHFAPAIGVISAAGFLEPKLFHPPVVDRIQLVDEKASQRRPFLAGKGAGLFLEVLELAAHVSNYRRCFQ